MTAIALPRYARVAGAFAGAIVAAGLIAGVTLGQGIPGPPNFALFYGTVQDNDENIVPAEQTMLAIVNGQVCGSARTSVAEDVPENSPEFIGKTVFTINVMADGDGAFQRPGCGNDGDSVRFYFPEVGRFAEQTGTFAPVEGGPLEANLTLGPELSARLSVPLIARDTSP